MAPLSWHLPSLITRYQETFLQCHQKCPKPTMAATHGGCAGGGVDPAIACDSGTVPRTLSFR